MRWSCLPAASPAVRSKPHGDQPGYRRQLLLAPRSIDIGKGLRNVGSTLAMADFNRLPRVCRECPLCPDCPEDAIANWRSSRRHSDGWIISPILRGWLTSRNLPPQADFALVLAFDGECMIAIITSCGNPHPLYKTRSSTVISQCAAAKMSDTRPSLFEKGSNSRS